MKTTESFSPPFGRDFPACGPDGCGQAWLVLRRRGRLGSGGLAGLLILALLLAGFQAWRGPAEVRGNHGQMAVVAKVVANGVPRP